MAIHMLAVQVLFALIVACSGSRAQRAAAHQEVRHKASLRAHAHLQGEDDTDEGGDDFEYGGKETEVTQSNAGDFSVHQFLVNDDARDGPSSNDNAQEEMARQKAAQADDHFNSEDTPDPDAFVQLDAAKQSLRSHRSQRQAPGDEDSDSQDEFEYGGKESEVTQSRAGDFSVHQFLVNDDARDGPSSNDNAQEEMARQKAAQADDHFNSEDTPDPDAFVQLAARSGASTAKKATSGASRSHRSRRQAPGDEDSDGQDEFEYGDKESEVTQSKAGDFSVHQFLVNDDARDGPSSSDNAREEMARQQAAQADDHFNSEDTPDPDAFVQLNKAKRASKAPADEDEDDASGDEYEYGGRESEVTQSNAGDFSVHQFLVNDDARDGPSSSDNAQEEMARQKAAQVDDHFNSEDTPDPDAFVQLNKANAKAARAPTDEDDDSGDEYEYGGKESEVTQSKAGDFSVHQFLVNDDARDGPSSADDNAATEMAKQKAAAADDHFNSEDTPDPNAFAQIRQRRIHVAH